MVTPSLVMVGAPHFLSITTLRPLGPSVTFTTSARASTPRCSASRASVSNDRIFDMALSSEFLWLSRRRPGADRLRGGLWVYLLLDDREHVAGGKNQVLVSTELDLGAAVLGEDDGVTLLDVQREPLAVLKAAGAD